MKSLLIFLISLFSLSFISKDINDDLAAYLKAGNAQSLATNFADKISIKILDVEDLISKAQAQALIEDFFAKHKVKNYTTLHSSFINTGHQFITGNLETNDGKYRVSILVRGNVISQFRIENDNG
jgi:hypothetical protein